MMTTRRVPAASSQPTRRRRASRRLRLTMKTGMSRQSRPSAFAASTDAGAGAHTAAPASFDSVSLPGRRCASRATCTAGFSCSGSSRPLLRAACAAASAASRRGTGPAWSSVTRGCHPASMPALISRQPSSKGAPAAAKSACSSSPPRRSASTRRIDRQAASRGSGSWPARRCCSSSGRLSAPWPSSKLATMLSPKCSGSTSVPSHKVITSPRVRSRAALASACVGAASHSIWPSVSVCRARVSRAAAMSGPNSSTDRRGEALAVAAGVGLVAGMGRLSRDRARRSLGRSPPEQSRRQPGNCGAFARRLSARLGS